MPKFKYKVGCINEKGILVIPCEFDEIGEFINGKAKAKNNDKYLFIDEEGNEVMRNKVDANSYIIHSIHNGIISNIVEFGIFVKLKDGLTALLHISELKKYKKSCKDYSLGEEVIVKILNIDKEKNRISLTLLY